MGTPRRRWGSTHRTKNGSAREAPLSSPPGAADDGGIAARTGRIEGPRGHISLGPPIFGRFWQQWRWRCVPVGHGGVMRKLIVLLGAGVLALGLSACDV